MHTHTLTLIERCYLTHRRTGAGAGGGGELDIWSLYLQPHNKRIISYIEGVRSYMEKSTYTTDKHKNKIKRLLPKMLVLLSPN